MNGLRSKHKILKFYLSEIEKAKVKVPPPKIDLILYSESIPGLNKDKTASYLFEMWHQGYFTFYPTGTSQLVEITNKGLETVVGEHFLIKSREIFWKSFMNISLTTANIVVAIAAVIALNANNGEVQKLKDQVREIEARVPKETAKASPNTEPNKPSPLSPLDTATKHAKTKP